ncbi:uncharacterized protein TNCT_405351 [Trichonephila clavata]|uniref:Uncharacterized protein n=1 Tax=Trichonephila clavata TaxID=2740835 RepID=A0A8X6F486_TRICU|nr:uncharacterized protein TNCT_405351 [Trichonephila clavata]
MNRLICLALLCNIMLYQFVDAEDECKEEIKKANEIMDAMVEDGSIPDCYNKYDLERFENMDEEDEEEQERMYEEFKKYLSTFSEEEITEFKNCMEEVGKMVMDKVEVSEECAEATRKMEEEYEDDW